MTPYVDPRELTAGYSYPQGKGVAKVIGVLRDGDRVAWRCTSRPGHRVHAIPSLATRCAQAELERRLQGARDVLWAGQCEPCGVYWDLSRAAAAKMDGEMGMDDASYLMRGWCPRCQVPFERVRLAVLERSVR
jgi:hypothetical protein